MVQAQHQPIVLVLVPMNTDRPTDMQALLAFYMEAGVDAVLGEEPVDRFAAEAPQPRVPPSPVVDATFRMADIRSAFEHLASGAQFGKVSLVA